MCWLQKTLQTSSFFLLLALWVLQYPAFGDDIVETKQNAPATQALVQKLRLLPAPELVKAAIAGMRYRQSRLRSICLAASETWETPKATVQYKYRFFRKDTAFWRETYFSKGDAAGLFGVVSWDGKTNIGFSEDRKSGRIDGYSISLNRDDSLKNVMLFDQLGMYMAGSSSLRPVADLVESCSTSKHGTKVSAAIVDQGGQPMIQITATTGPQVRAWILNPAKDFMTEQSLLDISVGDKLWSHDVTTTKKTTPFGDDGFVVPSEAVRTIDEDGGHRVCTFEVSAVSQENVFDDMQIPLTIKSGITVVNQIEHDAYKLMPDGSKQYLQFYNVQSGELSRGPATTAATTQP